MYVVVVMLGFARAKRYHLALISSAWLLLSVWVFVFQPIGWMVAIFAVLPLHLTHLKRVFSTTEARLLDPELKIVALSTFFLSLILFVTSLVG
jgi:1,4-dihydroxy-2-naphthoate octaprenyltransferase